MTTTLLPSVSGSFGAAPTVQTSAVPQGTPDIIDLGAIMGESPVDVPGEVPSAVAGSAAEVVVQEQTHPSHRIIPGEVIADAAPGGRVPKPVGQPGLVSRTTTAAKIRTLRALSGMKVKLVGTWERIPSQENLFTRTIVTMAVILMVTGAFSAWSGVALLDQVKETQALTTALEDTTQAVQKQSAKLKELSTALAEANRKLSTPWWKFWANW